jgi:Fe-S-cluster containining protein
MDIKKFKKRAAGNKGRLKKFLAKLDRIVPEDMPKLVKETDTKIWKAVDCLACANCCKTTGPLFTSADIERISKHFKQKPQQFIEQYLRIDEDNDYVLQSVPCTFLESDNKCFIYEVRPKACREFPHTNRKKFQQISNLTLKNVEICPAAFNIVEEMKKKIPL